MLLSQLCNWNELVSRLVERVHASFPPHSLYNVVGTFGKKKGYVLFRYNRPIRANPCKIVISGPRKQSRVVTQPPIAVSYRTVASFSINADIIVGTRKFKSWVKLPKSQNELTMIDYNLSRSITVLSRLMMALSSVFNLVISAS